MSMLILRVGIAAAFFVVTACDSRGPDASPSAAPSASAIPIATASPIATPRRSGNLVIVGRIVTMDDPPVVEAVLIKDGIVTTLGSRDEVLAIASDDIPIMDIGPSVAYPGFIDAHAHWIGDRDYYGVESAATAMDEALQRGWTSISEQWVNRDRLAELETLALADALSLRVDAYLALNEPQPNGAHFGDWYADRQPGPTSDYLMVHGVKAHLDTGFELGLLWGREELTAAVGGANAAGWQVSLHAFTTEPVEQALDAFEAVLGPNGPNPLHHRIEHAMQVTDDQLRRMVAMHLVVGIHLDTAVSDWLGGPGTMTELGGKAAWLSRWRDFVDAGLHVAATTDMPWILPDFKLTDDICRPIDQIAGGMDPSGRAYPEPPEWMAVQLLTAEEGLRAVTLDAAFALGDEARRGHLAPGTIGDVTILSGDVTSATPDDIRAMRVIATIVGGVPVYRSDAGP